MCVARQLLTLYFRREMGSPDWITKAEPVALAFQVTTVRQRGASHSVYVVLLHDPTRSGRWRLYVGQTSRDPDVRFDQHKAGHKASRAVKEFGVRLMPHMVEHLNPVRGWEKISGARGRVADGFRQAGIYWIEGGH